MPCDTISTVSVKFNQKTDQALLVAALTTMGLSPCVHSEGITFKDGAYIAATGEIQWRQTYWNRQNWDAKTAEIKRAYSAEVVKSQARRFGWQLKEVAPYQYEVMKR